MPVQQKPSCALQVPVVQILLGQFGLVTSQQFFAQWRYVVVGATAAAAVLTPSTDPFTQTLLAVPLIGLYLGGEQLLMSFCIPVTLHLSGRNVLPSVMHSLVCRRSRRSQSPGIHKEQGMMVLGHWAARVRVVPLEGSRR